nr:immunoglobulin light chain junction region [Macaca mulatta]
EYYCCLFYSGAQLVF